MENSEEKREYLSKTETDQISRSLLVWLNEYPDKPVGTINFEYLPPDGTGMNLSVLQGAYKVKEYIRGAYRAQYQFELTYRVQPGNSNNNRLKADEELDRLADWATSRKDLPDIGTRKRATRIYCNNRAALLVPYDDGSEDHQIMLTMEYDSF